MTILTTQTGNATIPKKWGWNVAGGYYLPKGRSAYRVWFSWKGKKFFINKYLDNTPLYHEGQAHRVIEKIRAEVDQGTFDPANWGKDKALLFESAWKFYVEQSNVSAARARSRDMIYRLYLSGYWKDFCLKEIEEPHIAKWFSGLPEEMSSSYKQLVRSTLKAFFNYFTITRRKLYRFPKIKMQKKVIYWLSKNDQEKVLEFIPSRYRAMIRFIMIYGCRPSEACNLRKADIDYKQGTITFKNRKNSEDNLLPLTPEAIEILKSQGKIENFQYAFCGAYGWKVSPKPLSEIWHKANQKANEKYGVKTVPLKNGTRHSLASQMRSRGISLSEISRILGNSEAVVEKSYGRISVERVAEVMDGTQSGHRGGISS